MALSAKSVEEVGRIVAKYVVDRRERKKLYEELLTVQVNASGRETFRRLVELME